MRPILTRWLQHCLSKFSNDRYTESRPRKESQINKMLTIVTVIVAIIVGVHQFDRYFLMELHIRPTEPKVREIVDKQIKQEFRELKKELAKSFGLPQPSDLDGPAFFLDKSQWDPVEAYVFGHIAYKERNYMQAIKIFCSLITKHPNHSMTADFYYWLGMSHFDSGNFTKSKEYFQKAIHFPESAVKDRATVALLRVQILWDEFDELQIRIMQWFLGNRHPIPETEC